jgi:Ca-activated chloride channel family protein
VSVTGSLGTAVLTGPALAVEPADEPGVSELHPATVTAPAAVAPGALVSVSWAASGGLFDEIRITLPADDADAAALAAIRVSPGQPAELTAPDRPGTYLVRYWSASAQRVLASAPLTVTGP